MEQLGIDLQVEEGIKLQESESAGSVKGSVAPGSVDEGKLSENNEGKGSVAPGSVDEGKSSENNEGKGSVAPGCVDEGKSSENNKGKEKLGKITKSSKFKKKPKENLKDSCWVCSGPHLKKDCTIWKKKRAQLRSQGNGDHGLGSGQEKQE